MSKKRTSRKLRIEKKGRRRRKGIFTGERVARRLVTVTNHGIKETKNENGEKKS